MNNHIKIINSLILSVFLLYSCENKTIFKKYEKFENYQWNKNKNVVFNVNIKDDKTLYDVIIAIRHTPQYPYANLIFNLTIYSPSGQERTKDHNVFIRNRDGSFIAKGLGDIYDIEFKVLEKINFNEIGIYKFEINSLMPIYTTQGLMDIGLIIKKSE
ncbi:MAG TPA: gliding motility lipoprotein GldH [Bacteroidales bacterium]|nr:gliding motility lipoprotein GldH [Bacteroidales bacterium]